MIRTVMALLTTYFRNVKRNLTLLTTREGLAVFIAERKAYIIHRVKTAPTYYANLKSVALLGLASVPWFLSHVFRTVFFLCGLDPTHLWGFAITPAGLGTTIGIITSGLIDACVATCLLRDAHAIPHVRQRLITVYLILLLCNFLSAVTTFGCALILGN